MFYDKIYWNFKIASERGHLNVFLYYKKNTILASDLYGI